MGLNAFPSLAAAGTLSRELEVGDRVLYRRGTRGLEHVGTIEEVTAEHYWICSATGEAVKVARVGQCVFFPPWWVVRMRAKAVRRTWDDPTLRRRMGLSL